jgi:sec-independent protein translocase protein TatC
MEQTIDSSEEHLGGQMSFLEHLDEFRKRLIRSIIFVALAFIFCWFVSDRIYNFLAIPVQRALAYAQTRQIKVEGKSGAETIQPLASLREGDSGRFVFDKASKLGIISVPVGTSVNVEVSNDSDGKLGVFTTEEILTNSAIIPSGVRLPLDLTVQPSDAPGAEGQLIVTTAVEPFTLYVTVSLYAAIALSVPFLLLQVWGFISPALYKHERGYVTPFILLSSIFFIGGMAFAYYILFPPSVTYLLGLGQDFQLMLKATDYFDLITLIMLAMGLIFQMPAITYILSRIGIVNARMLMKSWRLAIVIILIVAAVVSPTGDVPNLMLFSAPMVFLYLISILVAFIFGKKRKTDEQAGFA